MAMTARIVRMLGTKSNLRNMYGLITAQKKVLSIGDGDGGHGEFLLRELGNEGSNLTVTFFDSLAKIKEKYQRGEDNIEKLKKAGAVLMFDMDATDLPENHEAYLGKYELGNEYRKQWYEIEHDPEQNRKPDVVVMNFLCAENSKLWLNQTEDHANLYRGSFKCLSKILDGSGEVIVRLNTLWADNWKINDAAAEAGFVQVASAPFEQDHFPGYHPKQGFGKNPDGPWGCKNAETRVYKLMKTDD